MFFNVFNRAILCAGFFALSACGGGEPVNTPTSSVHPASHSVLQQNVSAHDSTATSTQGGGALRIAPVVSAAEREAEQLRMVPYEQAFAIEMQRRAQERPEHLREQAEPAHASAQAACDAAAQQRAAECLPTQPGAATAPAGQAL